jgi:hypothetical protein
MAREKKALLNWLLLTGAVGALVAGSAAAQTPQCIRVYACGSASDGGFIYCSEYC